MRLGKTKSTTKIQPCVVKQSKYERKDQASVAYWKNIVDELEGKVAVPYDERSELVASEIDPKYYSRIAGPLGLDPDYKVPGGFQKHQEDSSTSVNLFGVQVETTTKAKPAAGPEEYDDAAEMEYVIKPPTPRSAYKVQVPPVSPYWTFVCKKGKKAVNWESRYMPKHIIQEWEKTLHQRATERTNKIINDFCAWLRTLGGTPSSIDEDSMKNLFEIGHIDDAAQALMVRLKELPTVTQEVAIAAGLPERALRPTLHRQVMRDLKAASARIANFAFGTALPSESRHYPLVTNAGDFITFKNIPTELATMEQVWGGITAIRSTRAFCEWLHSHPEIDPPPYLVKMGLMDPDFGVSKGQPRVSVDPQWEEVEVVEDQGAAEKELVEEEEEVEKDDDMDEPA